tara:strand:+ start:3545 stop:3766 length:222 start_codon:yes stop_codon:yes gene_type:complete
MILVVRDRDTHKVIFHAQNNNELSWWIKRNRINPSNISVDYVDNKQFYTEPKHVKIAKSREKIIDDLLNTDED